ncbi:pyridoxamine 5'-phosphate oxidase family protein [Desulfohalovibrio reitneri]|uniref:pyridoxamine 5'-phosphate oxidase family protein n=1 Tax=Desulfohalovibrio reitneri TaxID=1307759 RepID=UPI0004A70E30|nr:pyridoxamine 5'-phosphate oxidase family protein [Desulfohalovibrio reitneri]
MRRDKLEIRDREIIEELLREGEYLVLSLNDPGAAPYAVPLNYAYEDGRIYLHSGLKGRKAELLRADPRVRFVVVPRARIATGPTPCKHTAHFHSLCGCGTARLLEGDSEKRRGLSVLSRRFAPDQEPGFPDKIVGKTMVIEIEVTEITGKRNPPPDEKE